MAERLELHETLCAIINITEPDGDRHTYFQPPASVKMKYPAIVYELDDIDAKHANNSIYIKSQGYKITVIDHNPDSEYVAKILNLPMCRFVQHFTSDNLHHFVFKLY